MLSKRVIKVAQNGSLYRIAFSAKDNEKTGKMIPGKAGPAGKWEDIARKGNKGYILAG